MPKNLLTNEPLATGFGIRQSENSNQTVSTVSQYDFIPAGDLGSQTNTQGNVISTGKYNFIPAGDLITGERQKNFQDLISTLPMPAPKEKSFLDIAKDVVNEEFFDSPGKTAMLPINALETAVGNILGGWVVQPIAGYEGIQELVPPEYAKGYKGAPTGGTAEQAAEKIRATTEFLMDFLPPYTRSGREFQKVSSLGAEAIFSPLMEAYNSIVTQPIIDMVKKSGGDIDDQAIAYAIYSTLPAAVMAVAGFRKGGPRLKSLEGQIERRLPKPWETKTKKAIAREIADNIRSQRSRGFINPKPNEMTTFKKFTTNYLPTVLEKTKLEKSGRFFVNNFVKSPQNVKSFEEAMALQKTINNRLRGVSEVQVPTVTEGTPYISGSPTLKFDIGSAFQDPSSQRAIEAIQNQYGPAALAFRNRLVRRNLVAMKNYLESIKPPNFLPEDERYVNRLREALSYKRDDVYGGLYEQEMRNIIKDMQSGMSVEQTGQVTREAIEDARQAVIREADKLIKNVPEDLIYADTFVKRMKKEVLSSEFLGDEPKKVVPSQVFKGVAAIEQNNNLITASDLYEIRKGWGRMYRAITDTDPAAKLKRRKMLKSINALDDAMRNPNFAPGKMPYFKWLELQSQGRIINPGAAAQPYREFMDYWLKNYVQVFDKKDVRNINRFETANRPYVEDAQVVGKFFQPEEDGIHAADTYIGILGERNPSNEGAYKALETWVDHNLLSKKEGVYDPESGLILPKKLENWKYKYRYALKKFGLEERYNDLNDVQAAIKRDAEYKDFFNKSAAARMLGYDPNTEILALRNSINKASDTAYIMKILKNDPKAVMGFQRTLIEQLESLDPLKAMDPSKPLDRQAFAALKKIFEENKEIYQEAFKYDPVRLRQLLNYQKAMERLFYKSGLPNNLNDMGPMFRRFYPSSHRGAMDYILSRMIQDIGKEDIRKIITDLYLNPESVDMFRKLGKKTIPKRVVDQKLKEYFYRIGLVKLGEALTTEKEKWEE